MWREEQYWKKHNKTDFFNMTDHAWTLKSGYDIVLLNIDELVSFTNGVILFKIGILCELCIKKNKY